MWQIAHEPMLEARRKPPRYSIVQNRTGRCGSLDREIHLANGEVGERPTQCTKWTMRMPFTKYYWQLVYIISAYMPEIRVNPEGVYMVSVHFVVTAMCLVVFLILLGPFLVPFAIVLCAVWDSDRKCHDWLLLLLMFGLTLLPPYLLSTMTMVAFQKETLQEFRKAENSMLELCGPYVCLLISSLVFLADVCQCSIEKGIAKMVLDEMDELNVIRKSGDQAAGPDSNLPGQLLEIIRYIDIQIHENVPFWPSRSLTSKFMKVMQQILAAVNNQDLLFPILCSFEWETIWTYQKFLPSHPPCFLDFHSRALCMSNWCRRWWNWSWAKYWSRSRCHPTRCGAVGVDSVQWAVVVGSAQLV